MLTQETDFACQLREMSREQRIEPLLESLSNWIGQQTGKSTDCINPDRPFREIAPMLDNDALRHGLLVEPWVTTHLGFPSFHHYETSLSNTPGELATYLSWQLEALEVPIKSLDEIETEWAWEWPEPQAFTGTKVDGRTLFILSSGRSGTSLFRSMLNCHEDIFAPQELHLLNFEGLSERREYQNRLAQQWMDVGIVEIFTTLFGQSEHSVAIELDQLVQQKLHSSDLYQLIHNKLDNKWLVDKTPVYAKRIEWLQRAEQMITEPRYIHLTRHPYAVMQSFINKRFYTYSKNIWGESVENAWHAAELFWTLANENILSFSKAIPESRFLWLTYEELMSDTEKAIQRVCNFLEIPFSKNMLDPYSGRRVTDIMLIDRSSVDTSMGDIWKQQRPPHRLSNRTRLVAEQLGYDLL